MKESCSWCHRVNDLSKVTHCPTCGHRADTPRLQCDCEKCLKK